MLRGCRDRFLHEVIPYRLLKTTSYLGYSFLNRLLPLETKARMDFPQIPEMVRLPALLRRTVALLLHLWMPVATPTLIKTPTICAKAITILVRLSIVEMVQPPIPVKIPHNLKLSQYQNLPYQRFKRNRQLRPPASSHSLQTLAPRLESNPRRLSCKTRIPQAS